MRQTNNKSGKKKNNPPRNNNHQPDKSLTKAFLQAEKDIEKDPEFSKHSPNDDLDEGETARLGEKTDLI